MTCYAIEQNALLDRYLVPTSASMAPVGTRRRVILPLLTSSWMRKNRRETRLVRELYDRLSMTDIAPVLSQFTGTVLKDLKPSSPRNNRKLEIDVDSSGL